MINGGHTIRRRSYLQYSYLENVIRVKGGKQTTHTNMGSQTTKMIVSALQGK